jgi:hypothetical protein
MREEVKQISDFYLANWPSDCHLAVESPAAGVRILVDHLKAQLAEREWVPVSERLPESEDSVLGYRPFTQPEAGATQDSVQWMDGNWYFTDTGYMITHNERQVTHWQPLPAPPKTEGDK